MSRKTLGKTGVRSSIVTAIFAIGVPVGVHAWVAMRTQRLADKVSAVAGVPATIGSIDGSLIGTVRISDVGLGELAHVDSIEASVAMSSLVDGQLAADEIRVDSPRLDISVDPDGDTDLARVGRRFQRGAQPHTSSSSRKTRLRRIVVDGGSLVAHVPGIGELSADGVELVPDDVGVRVVTGPVRIKGTAGQVSLAMQFPRAAAQIALPGARFLRVLAVAGSGTATTDRATVVFGDVALGRLLTDGNKLELHANVDDGGTRRPIDASLVLATREHGLSLAMSGTRVPLAGLGAIAPHALGVDRARASGSITITKSQSNIDATIDATLDGIELDHPRLAPERLPFTGEVRGSIALSPDSIVVRDVALVRGDLRLAASGWLRRGTPMSAQLDVTLASAPCAALFDALPSGLRAPLDGLALSGELGGRARLAIDLAAPEGEGVTLSTEIANGCTALGEPPTADVTRLRGVAPQTFPDGSRANVGPGEPGFVALKGLPEHVSGAFVSAEDGRFREHHGFDATQIARSFEIDLREHRLARGGSTISQQLVKNAFLTQRRSLDRKLQEAILTWRLEARLDKSQILERYLNIIELGPHIYGLANAAKYWFATTPAKLSVRQSAFLAALTSAPTSMSARVRAARGLDTDSRVRVDTILRAMRRDGLLSTAEMDLAKSAPLHWSPSVVDERDDGY